MNNQFPKIISIGGSSLVGSRINEILSGKYAVKNFSTNSGIDITRANTLKSIINETDYKYIILYAAKTNVDFCEKDKDLGENSMTFKTNVAGVQNVVDAAKLSPIKSGSSNKKLIYISTDFVFNGENTPQGGYTEEDQPRPINWYAQTKYKGEEIIRNSGLPFIIIRISYPYRKEFELKKDFARAILTRLQNNLIVKAITDHIMTPTFIDDIANALDLLIQENKEGVFHVTGSQSLSPYASAIMIAQKFGLNKSLITKTTRAEFFKGGAPRPFNLTMNNDKIHKLGIKMKTFEEGLKNLSLTS